MSENTDSNGESTFEFLAPNNGLNKTGGANDEQTERTSEVTSVLTSSSTSISTTYEPSMTSTSSTPLSPMASSCSSCPPSVIPITIPASMDIPLDTTSSPSPKSRSDSMSESFFGWIATNEFINKVAEKAKSSVDTMITTLDPGMKDIIYSGGDICIMVASDKECKILPIRSAFQQVFGRATVTGKATQSESESASETASDKSKSASGAHEAHQPVGFEEGLRLAKERISYLRSNTSDVAQNQVIVSVESFIAEITPDEWYELSCLVLSDPLMSINLQTYTQTTPIPNECVNQMRFETSKDYLASNNNGYSVTVGQVMADKLKTSRLEWHEMWVGSPRKQLIYQSAVSLAQLYKNRLSNR